MTATAVHRPAVRRRINRHDDLRALALFSGFGGLELGIEKAGFTTILAANHNRYKVEIHEANFPHAEHWIADLVDRESSDYHDARDLPEADFVTAGVSCVNHSSANTQKAYAQGLSLFDLDDPEFEERVTRSERDRATANCVLHYAEVHHPKLILVECTTELQCWGPAVPGKKYGDGTTYKWWLNEFTKLGYRYRELYLNSMFFDTPQSRDRLYIALWDQALPTPDLDHRPKAFCTRCDTLVEAVWTWKTGIPPTGSVRYGKQYNYRCPSCRAEVLPSATPAIRALDLSNLGTRIGDMRVKTIKDKKTGEVYQSPLARATLARAERCRQRFGDFPAVLMPAKAQRGSDRHPWEPMTTQTSQQELALLSTGALMKSAGNSFERPGSMCRTRGLDEPLWTQSATAETALVTPPVAMAVDNYQGAPRGVDEPLPTQLGSETLAVVSSGVLPFRKHTIPTTHAEPMPTFTAEQIPGLITAAGTIKNNGSIDEAKYRAHPIDKPLGTMTSDPQQSLLFSGWYKQNGPSGTETAPHPVTDPLGTLTARDTTAVLMAEWRAVLADLDLMDCYFRMMASHEIGRACGFDVDFGAHKGEFIVWGSERDRVDGFGNAVSPRVPEWIGERLRISYHGAGSA